MEPLSQKIRIKRVSVAILVFAVLAAAAYEVLLPRAYAFGALSKLGDKHLDIVPSSVELPNTTQAGSVYTYGSLSLTLPWQQSELTVRGKSAEYLAIRFQDGSRTGSIVVMKEPGMKEHVPGTATNYDAFKTIAMTTPQDVHLLGSTKRLNASVALLMYKTVLIPLSAESTASSFTTTQGIRGFEFTSATSTVAVVFTPNDTSYQIGFGNMTATETASVLQSIQSK